MLETREYNLPLPYPGPDDQAFWEGTKRHELLIQRCTGCGALRFWGKPMCPACNSFDSEAVPASGIEPPRRSPPESPSLGGPMAEPSGASGR